MWMHLNHLYYNGFSIGKVWLDFSNSRWACCLHGKRPTYNFATKEMAILHLMQEALSTLGNYLSKKESEL